MADHHNAARPGNPDPLPYREVTDEEYAVIAASQFTVEEPRSGTLILRGPCPRCHTIIDIPVVSGVFRTSRLLGGKLRHRQQAVADHVEPMMCTCEEGHPGRPDDVVGCGAYWTLTLSRQDG